jgi:hypothetical protein
MNHSFRTLLYCTIFGISEPAEEPVHLMSVAELEHGTQWGCTTMLDMGSPAMTLTDALRHRQGLADIRGSGNPASAPGGMQTTRMGFPASSAVTSPADAARFVDARMLEGADYIKVIVEDPGRMGVAALDGCTGYLAHPCAPFRRL